MSLTTVRAMYAKSICVGMNANEYHVVCRNKGTKYQVSVPIHPTRGAYQENIKPFVPHPYARFGWWWQ